MAAFDFALLRSLDRTVFHRLVSTGLFGAALLACGSSSKDKQDQDGQGADLGGVIFGEGDQGNDGRPGFDGEVCAGEAAGAERAPSVMQLLVDTSGSMDQSAPGGGGSKWVVTRSAMLSAIDGMPADTSLGVVFYPNVPNDNKPCLDRREAVNLAPLAASNSQQRQQIRSVFQRVKPQGGTPTHDAYRYALDQIGSTAAAGERFVVLITDGTPTYSLNCVGTGLISDPVDPSPLVTEAAGAFAKGIRTFVIGSPGSEDARESLSRMAEAGGTASAGCSHKGPNYCHFDMTSVRDLGAGLAGALQAISGLALSCRYDVPAPPNGATLDPAKVNVLFTPPGGAEELVPQSTGQGCSEGWQYSAGNSQVQLCGSTCDRVRGSDGALKLEFGCATQVR
jgi:hypothetical protein